MRLQTIAESHPYSLSKKYLGRTHNNLRVFQVNGEFVRDFLDVEFIGGCHHLVSKFIPKNEIWVEPMGSEEDQRCIIIHEMVEHMLMQYFGLTYAEAHRKANSIEAKFRQKFRLR